MEQLDDWRLEMSLLMPAALLAGQAGAPGLEGVAGKMRLKVERRRQEMAIIMQGSADVDTLLESLLALIRLSRGDEALHLDLTQFQGIDQLALSALVVVLRDQGGKFQRLTLSGLPAWANGRLSDTGAEDLLGRRWSGDFAPGVVSFYRC